MRDFLRRQLQELDVQLPWAVQTLKAAQAAFVTYGPRKAFEAAPCAPEEWLSPEQLPVLLQRYPTVPPYKYDPESLWVRACYRRRQIGRFVNVAGIRTLELACHDAMVSGILARDGAKATAIDLVADHVDPRAIQYGVKVEAADAEKLPFDDASFDCIFSYNAFEHFRHPEAVLQEALRVARPGGILFFLFGPLYRSSYGLHAMHAISVPFCQYLWQKSVLETYILNHGLRRIEFETLNGWTVQQFRNLWRSWRPWAKLIAYRESPSVYGLDLVSKYPGCFRSKVDQFEDLVVANLEIVLCRTDTPLAASATREQPGNVA